MPVSSVTKKTCDLLVAADKSSLSGKAKKARDYGIPVISVSEYLDSIS
jgi:DNA polymerase-3 subunit epsilon